MNLATTIILVLVLVTLVYLGYAAWKQKERVVASVLWAISAFIVLLFANTYIVHIPTPFDGPRATFNNHYDHARPEAPPITVPATNADPAAAAEEQRRRQEDALRHQQEQVTPKPKPPQ